MIKLFNEVPINQVFDSVLRSIVVQLNTFSSFKNLDPDETAERIAESHKIALTTLNRDNIKVEPKLETRSGRSFPLEYDVDRNKEYPNAYVYYTIPFRGNSEIFKARPNTFGGRTYNAEVGSNTITFLLSANYATLDLPDKKREELKRTANEIITFIEKNLDQINKEVTKFNETLKDKILTEIRKRINDEKKLNDLRNDLKL